MEGGGYDDVRKKVENDSTHSGGYHVHREDFGLGKFQIQIVLMQKSTHFLLKYAVKLLCLSNSSKCGTRVGRCVVKPI